jgi:serine/threonine protein kinase
MCPTARSVHALRYVGGYTLLRPLGTGGMSVVHLGYDDASHTSVAVKVLADHLAGDQQFVNRFYREAVLTRSLSHPALVRGLKHGFDPDAHAHFLALEFVDGPTAHAALDRLGRFPPAVAVRVALDAASALAHLHRKRLVHRDVKPDNLLLPTAGPAKLADLGLAKQIATDGHLTVTAQGFGTPHYMPYEQAVNAALADERSDVFALGATLYHLLTGVVPFPDSDTNPSAPRTAFVPAGEVRPDLPPAVDAALERMLAADPRKRFASMAEVTAALERCGMSGVSGAGDEYARFVADANGANTTSATDDTPTRLGGVG